MRLVKLLCVLGVFLPAVAFAQTGKIAGRVTDASTGEVLPGVNVVIVGTTQGATTDLEGYYSILNVRPGTHSVRATFIGFTPQTVTDVRVNIDLTEEVDFALQEETVGLDEVIVAAQRPVVQRDVAGSVANLNMEEMKNLPVASLGSVISLQAGNEGGLNIRGGSGDQISFNVDGLNLASGRGNNPFTAISYTSVTEVQVQSAGFSARHGNVRSGIINVVSREANQNRYFFDALIKYNSPQAKNFVGHDIDGNPVRYPNDWNAYYYRPLTDPEIAFDGTGSAKWDKYMRESYEPFSGGWNSKAKSLKQNTDKDPNNDATPPEMLEAVKWYMRKDFRIDLPDYEFDATIGGPVPVVSKQLGGLRFTASMRRTQEAWIVEQLRDNYNQQTFQGKLTSDISKGIKLNINGLWSLEKGLNSSEDGGEGMYRGSGAWDLGKDELFAYHWRNPMDVTYSVFGGKLTHTLSPKTFYEITLQRNHTGYNTFVTAPRDTTIRNVVGNLKMTEEPYGFEWRDKYDILGANFRTGGHWFSARDTSSVTRWQARFDITSQIDRYNQVQAGLEYIGGEYRIRHGEIDPAHPHHENPQYRWTRNPVQGAAYVEDKLEFKGLVANMGLRLDYFNAGGDWWVYDPFDLALSAQVGAKRLADSLSTKPTPHQFSLSPRLAISFPITENSKLFFNYGHFRNQLNPYSLFRIDEINTGRVSRIGNPDHPMPKTVQYELGFEQNLFNMFHMRLAGYYRDQSNQPRDVRYENLDGEVNYVVSQPFSYGDRRGFEVTLTKNRGKWIRGWVNYTYMAWKNGNFGFGNVYENPVRMRTHILTTGEYYQSFRVPEPYGRANLELLVPDQFGPSLMGTHPIGGWSISALGTWRTGETFTWTGNALEGIRSSVKEIRGNVKWRDNYDLSMRLSKNFQVGGANANFFVDIGNLLNIRRLERASFAGSQDDLRYYRSLHLPEEIFEGYPGGKPPYNYIPGKDNMGDFRKPGTPFVPIEIYTDKLPTAPAKDRLKADGSSRALFYVMPPDNRAGGTYYQWDPVNKAFTEADAGFVKEVLDNKQYIDMPNENYFNFMWPRQVNLGLRLSF